MLLHTWLLYLGGDNYHCRSWRGTWHEWGGLMLTARAGINGRHGSLSLRLGR